jgi:hypothetical protein
VEEQQKRLARLFVNGEFSEAVLRAEAARLQTERKRLEGERTPKQPIELDCLSSAEVLETLPAVAQHVTSWIQSSVGADLDVLLRALDIRVRACRERAVIDMSVPIPESLQELDLGNVWK